MLNIQKKMMNKKCSIIAVALSIGLIAFLLSGRSAEKTSKQAIEAMHENKPSKFVSLMCDETIEHQLESKELKTKRLLIKEYENIFDSFQEEMSDTFGRRWKYDAEIVETYDYETSEIANLRLSGNHKLKEIVYEINYTGKDDIESTESCTFVLIKKANKWYIVSFD